MTELYLLQLKDIIYLWDELEEYNIFLNEEGDWAHNDDGIHEHPLEITDDYLELIGCAVYTYTSRAVFLTSKEAENYGQLVYRDQKWVVTPVETRGTLCEK